MDKFIREYGIKKSRSQGNKQIFEELDAYEEEQAQLKAEADDWLLNENYEDWLSQQNLMSEWDDPLDMDYESLAHRDGFAEIEWDNNYRDQQELDDECIHEIMQLPGAY